MDNRKNKLVSGENSGALMVSARKFGFLVRLISLRPFLKTFRSSHCFLIILIFFFNTSTHAQNNENKKHRTLTYLNISCKGLTTFPDTIKRHYDYISISNAKDNLSLEEKCRMNRNTITDIPIEELTQFDSTMIIVDEDYFHIECAALINDSLGAKGVTIAYDLGGLWLSFESKLEQDTYLLDFIFEGYIPVLPNSKEYKKIAKDCSDSTLYYLLSYPYINSGNHVMSIIISISNDGTCFVSEMQVDNQDPVNTIRQGYYGSYKIRGNRLKINLMDDVRVVFKIRKNRLYIRKSDVKPTSSFLNKKNAIFVRCDGNSKINASN